MTCPEIIEQNLKSYRQLIAFAKAAQGFTIGFLEANFRHDMQDILAFLPQDHAEINWLIIELADPDLRFLRDELVQRLQALDAPKQIVETQQNDCTRPLNPPSLGDVEDSPHKVQKPNNQNPPNLGGRGANAEINKTPQIPSKDQKTVILLTGLEKSIGMTGDFPPVLQDLNFVRDDFVKSVPYPLVLCLPDYAISRLAKYAPDFWAWKSGLFHFQSTRVRKENALAETLNSDRIRGSLELAETQSRIDLLQRLLMDDFPSGHLESSADLKKKFQILTELGALHQNIGNVSKAEGYFLKVMQSIPPSEEFQREKAIALHEYGYLLDDLGEWKKAISLYKQSIDIEEKIRNIHGKAATLKQLADIYVKQGKLEEAIALCQQSLDIMEKIGDVKGKAATLHCMANVYTKQGKIEEAIALYQQSLKITEKIGDFQTQASTLHQLAGIYANQGKVNEAIALYRQVLDIDEKTGNIQGKAITQTTMAQLKLLSGEFEEAIQDLQASIHIFQKLKSPMAHQVQDILDQVLELQATP